MVGIMGTDEVGEILRSVAENNVDFGDSDIDEGLFVDISYNVVSEGERE